MFPTSRIKKIIKADKDLDMMTSEAVFMVGVATVRIITALSARADGQEYFIKHFMEEGYTKARLDRRKLVTYKDIGALIEVRESIRNSRQPPWFLDRTSSTSCVVSSACEPDTAPLLFV